ncbi:hypothetical protein PPACK8108_LOCUS24193 [Phakopsora pachyrhizi]|uniref:Uncharacterized protein n=1 Tax=Phakopsora pachyrhizi TaxID=170000 RepID=A0AAV0BSR4_PHAPC|nr:hypothetical protein PPACK8108_LOCUS24193 [Phakopsora pachyrhizi]
MNSATKIPARGPTGWVLLPTSQVNYHIKDFALEVLDGLITMPQGAYRRVGP